MRGTQWSRVVNFAADFLFLIEELAQDRKPVGRSDVRKHESIYRKISGQRRIRPILKGVMSMLKSGGKDKKRWAKK